MKSKFMLKSGILFLVIALLIGGIATVSLANNYGSRKGNNNSAAQGNQSQLKECDGICEENNEQACDGECDGTCDGNQIKVNGADLKAMSLADIAKLWGIDASSLLNEIMNTFNLKNTYTVENTIDDIRGEIRFSPFQIKDIADKLIAS